MNARLTVISKAADALRRQGWLSRLPSDVQDALLAHAEWREIASGASLTQGADIEGGMYGAGRGWIALRAAFGSADTAAIHFAPSPFWFGFVPLVAGRPRIVAAMAKTDVLAAYIPRHAFESDFGNRPGRSGGDLSQGCPASCWGSP